MLTSRVLETRTQGSVEHLTTGCQSVSQAHPLSQRRKYCNCTRGVSSVTYVARTLRDSIPKRFINLVPFESNVTLANVTIELFIDTLRIDSRPFFQTCYAFPLSKVKTFLWACAHRIWNIFHCISEYCNCTRGVSSVTYAARTLRDSIPKRFINLVLFKSNVTNVNIELFIDTLNRQASIFPKWNKNLLRVSFF